jgi:hypothetical protein
VATNTFVLAKLPIPVLGNVKLPPLELLCVDSKAAVEMVKSADRTASTLVDPLQGCIAEKVQFDICPGTLFNDIGFELTTLNT